jgi:sec-independent protein translocase protein TatC
VSEEAAMPLTGHLTELRNRILVIFGTVVVIFLGTYYFSGELLVFIQRPIAGQELVFLSPTEAFFTRLKVALYAAIFFGLPVVLYQIWHFCAPGMLQREKRYALIFVVCSTLLFVIGALFCYLLILPYGLSFLLSFATETITPQIAIGFYISFVFKLIMVFGIVFEVPLVTLILVQAGVVTPEFLSSNRSYVMVGAFVLSAALTPPDVVTQVLLAGPLIILYEISVVAARFIVRRKKKKKEEEDKNEDDTDD